MQIVEAEATDVADVVSLWERAGLTRPWSDARHDFTRAIASGQSTVLKAMEAEQLVGAAMVGDDGHRGWIYYLAVDEPHRRAGIGRALVHAAEAWLQGQGQPKIRLMVRNENLAVIEFYDALGYGDRDCVVLGRDFEV